MKKRFTRKNIINLLIVIFTFVSSFYTVSLMSNDNNVKAMEQAREDILMLSEAYKWIDEDDIDENYEIEFIEVCPRCGKLVICNNF